MEMLRCNTYVKKLRILFCFIFTASMTSFNSADLRETAGAVALGLLEQGRLLCLLFLQTPGFHKGQAAPPTQCTPHSFRRWFELRWIPQCHTFQTERRTQIYQILYPILFFHPCQPHRYDHYGEKGE